MKSSLVSLKDCSSLTVLCVCPPVQFIQPVYFPFFVIDTTYVLKILGEGRVCTFFKFCMFENNGLIFDKRYINEINHLL